MRVIVTRPLAQAAGWVQSLRERGLDAVALPLIAIAGAPDPAAVTATWATLEARRLVVFVSPNAVDAFFALAPPQRAWPAQLRAAAPGPGTTAALLQHGVPAAQIVEPSADAARFDSEALWQRLDTEDWHGAAVLIVRGSGGRDWLGARLTERGATVDHIAAYARGTPAFSAAERQLLNAALAEPQRHLWLFSSSEAIDHLAASTTASTTASTAAARWRHSHAIATHPRIAARAQQLGFGHVVESRPTLPAVVACIQSIRP